VRSWACLSRIDEDGSGLLLGFDAVTSTKRVGLRRIRAAADRSERHLVEQVLTFARRRDPQLREASLRKLVAESVSLLRASLPDAVELVVGDTADAVVLAKPAQLQQVILNLANNAAQAISHTGLVGLRTEIHSLPEARSLSHGFLAPGSDVCIVVTDHGHGIGPATQERIFEPFFTTKSNGSGLGLATAREIVAEHGGPLHVQSTVGVGSRFEVWLPLAATAEPAADEEVGGARIGRGETVLVLEQDRERLLRDKEILAALGFEPVGYRQVA
jgi:signal transduction histidine kinase